MGNNTTSVAVTNENPMTDNIKDYQYNQLAVIVPKENNTTAYLNGVTTTLPNFNMANIKSHLTTANNPLKVLNMDDVNAKVWNLKLYTQGRQLTADEISVMNKRYNTVNNYAIPDKYPKSNTHYSWDMGNNKIMPNHTQQHFTNNIYMTL